MTAPDTTLAIALASKPAAAHPAWRRLLLFGDGLGVAVAGNNLEVALVRVRPGGAQLMAAATIADFRSRPAAEWGAEFTRFLTSKNEKHLAATIVLPREEVIVRTVALAGVADQDVQSAIDLQIDTLHPWAGEDVACCWTRVSASSILVGIVRGAILTAWETLFSEAGVGVAAVTFSAAAIHSALRLREAAPASLLLYNDNGARREVYGESAARPVYSAEFGGGAERALASSRAELRLAADTMAVPLREALRLTGEAGALAWAAGLVSAAPLTSRLANLIPPSRRASHSRLQYALPAALTVLLLLALVGLFVILPLLDRKRTQALLSEELRRLEPVALRAQSMEKATAAARVRLAALSDVRARTQADLDVLNELSRLLPPQVWASQVEILSDTVTIAGEADQAGPLLRLLDSSPLFQNSEFTISVSRNSPQTELFRIRTMRRGRGGRTAQ